MKKRRKYVRNIQIGPLFIPKAEIIDVRDERRAPLVIPMRVPNRVVWPKVVRG